MADPSYFNWTAELFARGRVFQKPEALRGIRVLDLSVIIFGPATADYLGELGAEVIRVEMPGAGDVMRIVGPEGQFWKNVSPGIFAQNHSKYHVAIDLHKPAGQDLVRRLAAKSDILVENFRAGTLERKWGIGYRQLREINPRLIYVANTGFGQWGPLTKRASYDALAQAVSGFSAISGFAGRPPLKMGIYIGDYFGACLSALGALAALHYRDRTGQGQFLEVAQCEALIRAMDWTWVYAGLTGKNRSQPGNRDPSTCPSGIYPCRDGFVAVVAGSDEAFPGLCRAMGREDLLTDPRFATPPARAAEAHAEALDQHVEAWTRERTRAEVEALGRQHNFAAAPVATAADHYTDAHLRARGSVWEMEDPVYGTMVEHGPAPKLSETPARYKWAAKPVGFHNEYVLGGLLGLSPGQLEELERQRVIGKWADRPGPKPPDEWRGEGIIEQAYAACHVPSPQTAEWARTRSDPGGRNRGMMTDLSWEGWIREEEDPRNAFTKPEALDDLLVLDASLESPAGMICTAFLAELGAEVLKVEPPAGDPARAWGPPGFTHQGQGLAYLAEGRNKYYITLNLDAAEGREIFRQLAHRAAVVIEAYPPGRMDEWGIGYRQLSAENPALIYVAISARGQYGPGAAEAMPEHDLTSQAASGLTFITGEPQGAAAGPAGVPTKAGPWLAGYAGGAWAAFGLLGALHYRHATGRGQMVDVTPAEGLMRYLEYTLLWYHANGRIRERIGYYDLAVFPYTFIRVQDGWAFIAAYTDPNFEALCRIMGRPDLARDPRFSTTWARVQPENKRVLRDEIERWSSRLTADQILEKVLADPGPGVVVFGRVELPTEVLSRENWWERACFTRVTDPVYGPLTLQMPVWRMTGTPPRLRWPCRPVGHHNEHVYCKYLGLGQNRLQELRAAGVL